MLAAMPLPFWEVSIPIGSFDYSLECRSSLMRRHVVLCDYPRNLPVLQRVPQKSWAITALTPNLPVGMVVYRLGLRSCLELLI